MSRTIELALACAVALLWGGAGASAQSAAAAPEMFKDWELVCPDPKPKDQPRICEVRTIITGKEGARLGALAVAASPEPGASDVTMVATALLPLGMDLTLAPSLQVGDNKPVVLQFHRCLQRGCEAVARLDAAQLSALRSGALAKVAVGIGAGKTAVFELDGNLKQRDADPWCGIQIIDQRTGDMLQWIRLEGLVRKLFDVAVIPGARCPMAISPQAPEFASTVTRVDQYGSLSGA